MILKVQNILTGVIPRTYWNVTDKKTGRRRFYPALHSKYHCPIASWIDEALTHPPGSEYRHPLAAVSRSTDHHCQMCTEP